MVINYKVRLYYSLHWRVQIQFHEIVSDVSNLSGRGRQYVEVLLLLSLLSAYKIRVFRFYERFKDEAVCPDFVMLILVTFRSNFFKPSQLFSYKIRHTYG
jgi:hypothetical protein